MPFNLTVQFTIIVFRDYISIYKCSDNFGEWQYEENERFTNLALAFQNISNWHKNTPLPNHVIKRVYDVVVERRDDEWH